MQRAGRRTYLIFALSTAFVGATVGVERSTLSLLGEDKFGLSSRTALLSFLVAFGLAKAAANLASGPLAGALGPVRLLRIGWVAALGVPPLLIFSPSWGWVIAANGLLGVNQGLCWSVGVVGMMKAAGSHRRGTAAGFNEFSGYMGAALAAGAAGYLASKAGIRTAPFLLMQGLAVAGLVVSLIQRESGEPSPVHRQDLRAQIKRVSWSDKKLSSLCLAGLVTNLTDAVAWALFPLLFKQRGLALSEIGLLTALYPAVWATAQGITGRLSDRIGRKPLIVSGLAMQAAGVASLLPLRSFAGSITAMTLLGMGTALCYPTLLASVGDLSSDVERPAVVGIYRLWRDLGYVAGALVAGVVADLAGAPIAIATVAGITLLSAIPVTVTLRGGTIGGKPPVTA